MLRLGFEPRSSARKAEMIGRTTPTERFAPEMTRTVWLKIASRNRLALDPHTRPPDVTIELYLLSGCPYCRKVERKLDELDLEYETHNVPPLKSRRSEVKDISGQAGVPVLVDSANGIEGMAESAEIVVYLERTYG